jgi:hypothetical protein
MIERGKSEEEMTWRNSFSVIMENEYTGEMCPFLKLQNVLHFLANATSKIWSLPAFAVRLFKEDGPEAGRLSFPGDFVKRVRTRAYLEI